MRLEWYVVAEPNMALTRAVSPEITRCELTYIAREPIDYARAVTQHGRYRDLLREHGFEVIVLPADSRHPDCTFVEDPAVVVDEVAVITRMGAESRRGEEVAVERALLPYRLIVRVEPPATIDGGDVLCLGRSVFVGVSARTDNAGVDALRRLLAPHAYRVIPVAVTGCLHLKSACTAIDDETVLVNGNWIDTEPLSRLRMVPVAEDEPRGAEVLRLGDALLMPDCFPRTRELVEAAGHRVCTLDLSEFVKAEAGPTCLSILFWT